MNNKPDICSLALPDGTRLEVDSKGLLFGRGPGADVHLAAPEALRRHALVYTDKRGPQLVALGEEPILVNQRAAPRFKALKDGDVIGLPGMDLAVVVRCRQQAAPTGWLLRHGRMEFVELPRGEFRVGGLETCDLHLPGWPGGVLTFHLSAQGLECSFPEGITHNGAPLEGHTRAHLDSGDRLVWAGEALQVLELGLQPRANDEQDQDLPLKVLLRPIPPAGGQVTLSSRSGEWTAFIPEMRFDLLCILLQPPGPYRPNEELPDTLVAPRVCGVPLHAEDDETLPKLVRQLRKDLECAGVDANQLISRVRTRTRFHLAQGATVVMLQPR